MKAMIFAAGLGTRLRPQTDSMPKALIRVGGRALVDILIEKFVGAGVKEIVVNVHHLGGMVVEHLLTAYGGDGRVRIRISDERDCLLDTGGGLRKAAPLLAGGGPFVVHNVDVLSNVDLKRLYEHGVGKAAGLLVSERSSRRFLLFDDDMRLVGWTCVATGEVRTPFAGLDVKACKRLAFSGIQVFSPGILPYLERMPKCFSIIDFYLSVCKDVPIYGVMQPGFRMLDVGKPSTLQAAESFINNL